LVISPWEYLRICCYCLAQCVFDRCNKSKLHCFYCFSP